MSKPRYSWWGYVKAVIRAYPSRKKELEDLRTPTLTASASGMPTSGGSHRGTEDTALRTLPRVQQKELEAVEAAVALTKLMDTGKERMTIVECVFFRQTHTLQGAAYKANVSYDRAIDYHGEFIRLVAYHLGLIEQDEIKHCLKKP